MLSARSTAVLVAGLLVAACGGGGGGNPATPSPNPGSGGGGGGGGTGTPVTITIVGVNGKQSFSPNPATVPAGQMAIFRNNDVVVHRVVIDDRSIDTGDIAPGASSQPLALGAVNKSYHCSLHPNMVGSLNSAQTPEPEPCTGYCG